MRALKTEQRVCDNISRIAVVSDTHGRFADGLPAALTGAELIVHAGDVGDAAVLEALALIAPVAAVRGNNDIAGKWPCGDHAVLAAMPDVITIHCRGGTLVVVHGHQFPRASTRHDALRSRWPQARCIVYGHSHRRVRDHVDQPWVINPGAAGRARAYGGAGWLGVLTGTAGWQVTENGFPA